MEVGAGRDFCQSKLLISCSRLSKSAKGFQSRIDLILLSGSNKSVLVDIFQLFELAV